jgi:hypothetical protein
MSTIHWAVAIIMALILMGLLWAVGWFIKEVFFSPPQALSANPIAQNTAPNTPPTPLMNQGDYHSGPEGYSPNTAYPDTFYGSGDFGDADENNEGYFR